MFYAEIGGYTDESQLMSYAEINKRFAKKRTDLMMHHNLSLMQKWMDIMMYHNLCFLCRNVRI